mgnify:CR=1 FL=1
MKNLEHLHYNIVIEKEKEREKEKESEKEKEKAAQELAEGEDEEEDLREVDYLQKLITLSVKFDHHIGMYLMPAFIVVPSSMNTVLSTSIIMVMKTQVQQIFLTVFHALL